MLKPLKIAKVTGVVRLKKPIRGELHEVSSIHTDGFVLPHTQEDRAVTFPDTSPGPANDPKRRP